MNNNMYCDLHAHTIISDGVYTPDELVQRAIGRGINVLCITDHNAVNPELPELRALYPQIELPSGCEFSCNYTTVKNRIIQLHIGGIAFDQENERIQKAIAHNQGSMRGYIEKSLYKLKVNCGIDLCTYDELLSRNPFSQTVGRKHLAEEMIRQGISKDVDDAFDTYLSNRGGYERPAYVSNALNFVPLEEVVQAVLSANGIISLCHLFEYQIDAEETECLLEYFAGITEGCGAMEVYYSSYTKEQQEGLRWLADNHHLLYSAASDFHGDSKKVLELGQYPYSIYECMMKAIANKY